MAPMGWLDKLSSAIERATDLVDLGTPVVDDTRRHRRGAMLWQPRNPRRYYKELERAVLGWEREVIARIPGDAPGLRLIGRAGLTRQQETLGIGLLGAIGSGKTQVGEMLVAQAIKRGDLIVVTDAKGDLTRWLLTRYRVVRLLAPWDRRSMVWALHEDVQTRTAAEDLAKALLPERIEGRDPFWTRSARLVAETVILHLIASGRSWGFSDVWLWISRGPTFVASQFAQTMEGREALELITSKSQRAASVEDVWRTIVTYLSPLRSLAAAWPSVDVPVGVAWSARAWLAHAGPQVVVLPMLAAYDTIARTTARLAVEMIAAQLLTMPDSRGRRVLFFLDEFNVLGELPALGRLLTQARSKGGVPILGLQDIGALRAAWGRDKAMSILNALGTLVVYRQADPDLADYAARGIGKREVEEHHRTETRHEGSESSRSRGEQVHVRDEYVVHPSDLQGLPSMTAYVRAPGWPQVVQVAWEIVDRTGTEPPVVEADWLRHVVTPIDRAAQAAAGKMLERAKPRARDERRRFDIGGGRGR